MVTLVGTDGVRVEQIDALDVQCRSITVTDDDGKTRLRIGVTPSGAGQLEIYEESGEMIALVGSDGVKVHEVEALDVQCRSFTVTDADGEKRLRIGVAPSGAGQLAIYKGSGEMVALVGADQLGQSGLIKALGPDGQVATYVGFREDGPGLFVHDAESGLRLRMTSSVAEWLELVRKPLESSKSGESP